MTENSQSVTVALAAKIGGTEPSWDFTTANGAVFWMNPADGPSGTVVLAQLTGASGTATAVLQGRSAAGADWQEDVSWSL